MKKRVVAALLILLLLVMPNVSGVFGSTKGNTASTAPSTEPAATTDPAAEAPETEAPETEAPETEAPETEIESTEPAAPETDSDLSEEEQAFLIMSKEDRAVFLAELSDDEALHYYNLLSEQEKQELVAYIAELMKNNQSPMPITVPSTEVGPFLVGDWAASGGHRPHIQQSSGHSATSTVDAEGLVSARTVTKTGDNYKVRVEAYATGETINVSKPRPVDFVLVLDKTKSMAEQKIGSKYRIDEMKTAVNSFIDAVADKYDPDFSDHRISIITFGNDAEELVSWTNVTEANAVALKQAVTGINATDTYTNTAAGVSKAYEKVKDSFDHTEGRVRVVLLFTDGVPYVEGTAIRTVTFDGGWFAEDVTIENTRLSIVNANSALSKAKRIKELSDTTLYTVGVFDGANVNELYGKGVYTFDLLDWILGRASDSPQDPCTSSYPFFGYSSWNRQSQNNDFGTLDISALNRFMNLLSSNYSSRTSIDLEYHHNDSIQGHWSILQKYYYFKVTGWITKDDAEHDKYYAVPKDATGSLKDIFVNVAHQIQNSDVTLDSSSVLVDTVEPYFSVVPDSVKVKYADATTNGADWGTEHEYTDGAVSATVHSNEQTIQVTGFDYAEYYLSTVHKDSSPYYGRKLILEYTVAPSDGFLGGDEVPVNTAEAAILDQPDGTVIENLSVETVSVPLAEPKLTGKDINVYLRQNYELTDYLAGGQVKATLGGTEITDLQDPGAQFEDWQKEFVTLSLTKSWEPVAATGDGHYRVTFQIQSRNDSTNKKTATPIEKDVRVFKPELTLRDENVFFGQSFDLGSLANKNMTLKWKHGTTASTAVTMLGDEPQLNLIFACNDIAQGKVDRIGDLPVTVSSVKINGHEVLSDCGMIHTACSVTADPALNGNHLWLHSNGASLTITRSGGAGQSFVYRVQGEDGTDLRVAINGGESVTITGLRVGTYTVKEAGSWSWRFARNEAQTAGLTPEQPSAVKEFLGESNVARWLSGLASLVISKTRGE